MTTTEPPPRAVRRRPRATSVLVVLALALVVALLTRTFLVQTFAIPTDSMDPALRPGERVLVLRPGADDVRRGDVVVFDGSGTFAPAAPEPEGLARATTLVGTLLGSRPGESDFVKRVVGVGGDRITCCDAQGRLLVDGVPLEEPYLHPGDAASELRFDVEVPQGRLWLMGDHRSDSADSRSHLGSPGGGTVAVDDVVGRVVATTWPLSRLGALPRGEGS